MNSFVGYFSYFSLSIDFFLHWLFLAYFPPRLFSSPLPFWYVSAFAYTNIYL